VVLGNSPPGNLPARGAFARVHALVDWRDLTSTNQLAQGLAEGIRLSNNFVKRGDNQVEMIFQGREEKMGILLMVLIPVAVIWQGFVLSKLWEWFLVPLGVHGIGVTQAIGVMVLVGLCAHQSKNIKEEWEKDIEQVSVQFLVYELLNPLLLLVIGWISHLCM
jgi:hypothetical protein